MSAKQLLFHEAAHAKILTGMRTTIQCSRERPVPVVQPLRMSEGMRI